MCVVLEMLPADYYSMADSLKCFTITCMCIAMALLLVKQIVGIKRHQDIPSRLGNIVAIAILLVPLTFAYASGILGEAVDGCLYDVYEDSSSALWRYISPYVYSTYPFVYLNLVLCIILFLCKCVGSIVEKHSTKKSSVANNFLFSICLYAVTTAYCWMVYTYCNNVLLMYGMPILVTLGLVLYIYNVDVLSIPDVVDDDSLWENIKGGLKKRSVQPWKQVVAMVSLLIVMIFLHNFVIQALSYDIWDAAMGYTYMTPIYALTFSARFIGILMFMSPALVVYIWCVQYLRGKLSKVN